MEERTYAKECGLRCSRLRMAQGMSQQELAEKVFTTAQNISKYEKNGISNIDMIRKISEALGHDILIDETDAEGIVGEIGKEILWVLIQNGGNYSVGNLISDEMYGMSTSRVNQEIFKLEHIGMCVREQYNGFDDKQHDHIFLTAKGIITYKNIIGRSVLNAVENAALQNVISYEQMLKGAESYQAFVDEREAEKLIRNLDEFRCGDYRINYIYYLRENHEEGFEEDYELMDPPPGNIVPHKGFYHDLIYRMALRYDREMYKSLITATYFSLDEIYELNDLQKKYGVVSDSVVYQAEQAFLEEFPEIDELDASEYIIDSPKTIEEVEACPDRYIELLDKSEEADLHYEHKDALFRLYFEEGHPSAYPTRWFSDEEIREFISENILPAETEAEKELDNVLKHINELKPETLGYYAFPHSWEQNGLAQLVRDIYKI